MQITLKTARRIEQDLNKEITSVQSKMSSLITRVDLTTQGITGLVKSKEALASELLRQGRTLCNVRWNIRQMIGDANYDSGITERSTWIAQCDQCIAFLQASAQGLVGRNSNGYTAEDLVQSEKKQAFSLQHGLGVDGSESKIFGSATFSDVFPAISKEYGDKINAEIKALTSQKRKYEDECAGLNVTTTITLLPEDVAVLKSVNLI